MDKKLDEETTYVLKGVEVMMTGRVAKKAMRSGKEETLYEVKPTEFKDSSSTKANSWVKLAELYKVTYE